MRFVAVAFALLLSGCTVQYESNHSTSHSQCFVNGEEVPCGESVCTINGQRVPCGGGGPTGPNETIAIHDRMPLTQAVDQSWTFSVHPGASTASARVMLAGYQGAPAGLAPTQACIEWSGPHGTKTSGTCSQSTNVQVAPKVVVDGGPGASISSMYGGWSGLRPGDYRLAVEHAAAAADLVVEIVVDY